MVSFQQYTIFNGQLILGAPEVSGDPSDLVDALRPSIEDGLVQGVVDKVSFNGSSDNIQFIVLKWTCWMLWQSSFGRFFVGESRLVGQQESCPPWPYTQ